MGGWAEDEVAWCVIVCTIVCAVLLVLLVLLALRDICVTLRFSEHIGIFYRVA